MNKKSIYLLLAAFIFSLTACTTPPEKDVQGLSTEIDAALAGHYGQSMYHEELAEEELETANNVLDHWQNDYYWNIDERQKAMDAAQAAAQHRVESERHLCEWLSSVHGHHHHGKERKNVAAYFKTGSSVPYKTNEQHVVNLGTFLKNHPDAKAEVTAYTDTVGSAA
ncbi:MAG: OmpA family protein, partial [Gammaproteobacteria bacterium]